VSVATNAGIGRTDASDFRLMAERRATVDAGLPHIFLAASRLEVDGDRWL